MGRRSSERTGNKKVNTLEYSSTLLTSRSVKRHRYALPDSLYGEGKFGSAVSGRAAQKFRRSKSSCASKPAVPMSFIRSLISALRSDQRTSEKGLVALF